MLFELTPVFDSRQSFYNKAYVRFPIEDVNELNNSVVELLSYGTHVLTLDLINRKVTLLPRWNESATTLRHVKELLKQNGFTAESISQITKDYT